MHWAIALKPACDQLQSHDQFGPLWTIAVHTVIPLVEIIITTNTTGVTWLYYMVQPQHTSPGWEMLTSTFSYIIIIKQYNNLHYNKIRKLFKQI